MYYTNALTFASTPKLQTRWSQDISQQITKPPKPSPPAIVRKLPLDDLLHDSPMTQVAASRFKRLLSKAGHGAAESFRELLVDVVSEAAKKAIWGPGA